MPTNEQRRATAKRKLERQLERRADNERKRRLYTIIGSAVAAVVVIGAVVATIVLTNRDSSGLTASATSTTSTPSEASPLDAPGPTQVGSLPAFQAPEGLGGDCQYTASAEEASKPNTAPRSGKVPTEPAEISASMATNQATSGCSSTTASHRAP